MSFLLHYIYLIYLLVTLQINRLLLVMFNQSDSAVGRNISVIMVVTTDTERQWHQSNQQNTDSDNWKKSDPVNGQADNRSIPNTETKSSGRRFENAFSFCCLNVLPLSGRSWYWPFKVLCGHPLFQSSRVPRKTEQNQEEHLGSQQTRRAAVGYAVYVHGI